MKLVVLRLILILVLMEIVRLNSTGNIAYNPVDIAASKDLNG